jgi:hypothetical protein
MSSDAYDGRGSALLYVISPVKINEPCLVSDKLKDIQEIMIDIHVK